MADRVINFSAGPAHLPLEVLEEVQADLLNYKGAGMSVMEMSHRGKHFQQIITETEEALRRVMSIPDNYKVLFMQGGGTAQFSAVPFNLMAGDNPEADYIVTGGWSAKAQKEACKYGKANMVFPKLDTYTSIPPHDTWTLSPTAQYVYYCDNETVYGVEFADIPDSQGKTLVADISSNFLTRPVDVSKFGLLFAGVQKNAGPAGLTIVIVRDDLLGNAHPLCPSILDYKFMADGGSMPNTPPCWSIYVTGLVVKWVEQQGGLAEFADRSSRKSTLIYDAIAQSNGFYACPVDVNVRSRVNVPFRICQQGEPNAELEAAFLKEAEAQGMVTLKGHRSVGGIRASLYNATTVEETQKLRDFMVDFAGKHQG